MTLVQWECDCTHIWYEDSESDNYPNYCPVCATVVSPELNKTGKTIKIKDILTF